MLSPKLKKNLPLIATLARIALTPLLFVIFYSSLTHKALIVTVIFCLAAITDWLDGYLARLWSCESTLGKYMDPVADKILVISALILLLDVNLISPVLVYILISRDILIGGIRSAAASEQLIISAAPLGKIKTAVQMIALPLLFLKTVFGINLIPTALLLLWLSVVLSLVSGYGYVMSYLKNKTKNAATNVKNSKLTKN